MSGAVVVTGATGELAPAIIECLIARGDRLLLVGRSAERLASLEQEFGVEGIVEIFQADVSDAVQASAVADRAVSRFGGVAGLVHLVGGFAARPVVFMGPDDYSALVEANFLSAVTATQALLPHLGERARLVYFSTPLADEPLPAMSGYGASKAALVAWVKSLSHEVKGQGIHANVVVMTVADTPAKRLERPDWDFDQTVTPEAVAGVVAFLIGPMSDGVYGACVPVLSRFGFTSVLSGPPPSLVGGAT